MQEETATTVPNVPAVKVSVGMLTYRRPDRLALGLPAVIAQVRQVNAATGRSGEVIVIDNDPEGSAQEYVRDLSQDNPELRYVSEPSPGIASARQRCLDEAGTADLLQFIDDDELPETGWLISMVRTWADSGRPAAVAGLVKPRFLSPPDEFVRDGRFFYRKEYPTGTRIGAAPTNNLLLDLGQVSELRLGFDRALGFRGGEDTLFTRQLAARGGRIVFCREAVVYDLVPDDRNSKSWVLRRAWHHGSTHSFVALRMAEHRASRLAMRLLFVASGLGRTAAGLAWVAVGKLRGSRELEARGLRIHWRGRGIVRGAVRPAPPEYQR